MSPLTADGGFCAIAHRGNPVDHRENTLAGVADAVAAGADLVEIDVKVTRDGEAVLLHDASLQRLWEHPALVADLDHAELSRLFPGDTTVPRLGDALALLTGTRCGLLIDLDSPDWAEASLTAVRRSVADGLVRPEQVLWCGRDDSLQVVRTRDPEARIILSWDETNGGGRPPGDALVRALRPEAYNPHWPMITADAVAWTHRRGLAASCWTVDDPDLMRRLLDLGVDALISNHIRTLREVVDARAQR